MKKITNSDVSFVASKLDALQYLVARPIVVTANHDSGTYKLYTVEGQGSVGIADQIGVLLIQYQAAAAAYLMRRFARDGRINDAISAGKLADCPVQLERPYTIETLVRITNFSHMPSKAALVHFLAARVKALVDAENAKRVKDLADYVALISGEIIPPDPTAPVVAPTPEKTEAPEAPVITEADVTPTVPPVIEIPADLAE